MRKIVTIMVISTVFAIMAVFVLVGCGISSSSASVSASAASASANASSSAASTSGAVNASGVASPSVSAASSSASAASASSVSASASGERGSTKTLITVDGVDLNGVAIEMVGDTPNLQLVFANETNKDVEFDLSPFRVLIDDKDEVNFHLTKITIKANTPYLQRAETASPGSMKVGDSAAVYYGDMLLGTFEVGEF